MQPETARVAAHAAAKTGPAAEAGPVCTQLRGRPAGPGVCPRGGGVSLAFSAQQLLPLSALPTELRLA